MIVQKTHQYKTIVTHTLVQTAFKKQLTEVLNTKKNSTKLSSFCFTVNLVVVLKYFLHSFGFYFCYNIFPGFLR